MVEVRPLTIGTNYEAACRMPNHQRHLHWTGHSTGCTCICPRRTPRTCHTGTLAFRRSNTSRRTDRTWGSRTRFRSYRSGARRSSGFRMSRWFPRPENNTSRLIYSIAPICRARRRCRARVATGLWGRPGLARAVVGLARGRLGPVRAVAGPVRAVAGPARVVAGPARALGPAWASGPAWAPQPSRTRPSPCPPRLGTCPWGMCHFSLNRTTKLHKKT